MGIPLSGPGILTRQVHALLEEALTNRRTTITRLVAAFRSGLDLVVTTALAYDLGARHPSSLPLARDPRCRGARRDVLAFQ
jgi:hypothetical protein